MAVFGAEGRCQIVAILVCSYCGDTLALAGGRDAQPPLAVIRMWSCRPKRSTLPGSGAKVTVSPST